MRLEIATGLGSGIAVIPVLVGGTRLPRKADLPVELQPLTDQHAVTVTTNGFRNEMAGLARDIRRGALTLAFCVAGKVGPAVTIAAR